jgi:hypothetical protein
MGRIDGLAGDADAAGDAELDFVIVCAASDKEKSRGAVIAAAIKETLDFMDFGLVKWRISYRNLPSQMWLSES